MIYNNITDITCRNMFYNNNKRVVAKIKDEYEYECRQERQQNRAVKARKPLWKCR